MLCVCSVAVCDSSEKDASERSMIVTTTSSVSCAVLHSVMQSDAECCSVLQCVAVCCSVLQCVAVCCSVLPPPEAPVCCMCMYVCVHAHALESFAASQSNFEGHTPCVSSWDSCLKCMVCHISHR